MSVVGFNFTKITAERKGPVKGQLSIDNNVRLLNVEEAPIAVGETQSKALKMDFEFKASYNPEIGEITFEGELLEVISEEDHAKALAGWKEKKAVDKELMRDFINTVFRRCTVQAIITGREIHLPPPIRLPTLKEDIQKKED